MFGPRNGASNTSRPASSLANHPKPIAHHGRDRPTETEPATLRRRISSESISSIGSASAQGAAAKSAMAPHPPPQHPPMSRGNIGQQHNSNAPIANKELNIQVVVRIRARSEREVRENSPVAVQTQNKEILVPSTLGDRAPSKSYSFDRVFMYSDQECIYNEVVTPILDEVLTGYNCTIFAYGQTGTGKTFTMEGDLRDNFGECSRDAGIIPRTLYTLFAALERKNTEYTVRVSFLELYNEEVKDLLVPDDDRKVVKIFDSVKKQGPLVQGLEEVPVFNPGQGIDALRKGSAKRTVAATKSNDKSSRSHGVFSITVHVKETADDGEELLKIGKLNLVDLAGSENIARSGAEATQAKEAGRINQSLLTLGRVINSLVERSQHIPYRESKLTRLLEDSLGGKTKTCIIATISPARSCLEETISTLNYANRAKNIKNTPEINQKMSKRTLIKEYLVEIDRLKADLNATREKNGVFMTQESYQTLLDENSSNKDLVGETQKHVDRISQELERVEEKFRENMKLLSATEMKLESKRVELLGIREELEKTKQVLQEETLLRQAHAHTEDQLNSVASGLRSTLAASVKDIRGLHEKLERKNMIERENRRALVEFQERLMALSGELGERIQGFGSNQTGFLDMVTERLDKAFKEATYGAESAQTFLNDQLERMSKAMDNFSALDINTSDRALVFRREFEALRLEITEFLKSRAEISKSNALEGFSGLKAALMEFNGLVDKQQEAMTTRVLGLVDESTKFSRDSISRHQLALDSCQKATSAEIEFLTLQNLTLRQQLKDQEARRDEQKNALLSEIGGLLDSFLRDQTSVVMSHFTGACEALEGSTSRLNTAHSEQRDWVTQFERLGAQRIQELIDTRGAFEKEGVEGRAMIARDGEGMITRSDALRSSIEVDLQSQQEFMQTRMFEMNTKAIGGLEQMQSQQTALAEMFSQTSNHSTTALQDLNTRARTMNMNMTSVYNRTLDDMNAVKGKTQLFSYDASHNLDLAREEMKNLVPHRLKVDDSTGRTPSRRKYTYPQTWSRTRPSQDLLKEFRELGQVKVFTMDQPVGTFDLSESDDSAPVSPSPGQGPDLTDLNLSGSTVAHISPSDADDLRHDTATVNSSEQRLKDSDLLAADIQDESLSGPASRRASLSSTRLEAEKEKENSAKIQSTALGAGNALRPIRPPGKFGLNSITDLGFRRKVGAVQSAPGLSSLLSKRSAPELEDEDAEGNNHTNNLTDISNSIHPTLPNPSQAKTNGATPPPSVATAPSGLTAFGTGKSGMMNSAEGPRKVIRTAHVKPVRRGFPFGGNNKS